MFTMRRFQHLITGKKYEKTLKDALENTEIEKRIELLHRKAIINGLLYDTSKADRVCEYCVESDSMSVPGMAFGEFRYAILFRTHKGNFFIQQYGKLYSCDDSIAKNILKYSPDKYQEFFGKVEEA